MPQVAGTNLNGELAMHFENVCGSKGYSYDAFEHNARVAKSKSKLLTAPLNDIYSTMTNGECNRGNLRLSDMIEIGFEDCDYTCLEANWSAWVPIAEMFGSHNMALELHVPCREPIDHLMSQCNAQSKKFDCSLSGNAMLKQVDACVVKVKDRFSEQLATTARNMHLKCFDSATSFTDYILYMDKKLQRKQIEAEYVSRITGNPRERENECIWRDQYSKLKQSVKAHLQSKYDYYRYCGHCLGSKDDLLADIV
ncbi:unnamed protein product [Ectocarpus fasciculatus]